MAEDYSPEDILMRKRAYYPTINSCLGYLQSASPDLENKTIRRIIISSKKEFANSAAVQAEIDSKPFLPSIGIYFYFTAGSSSNLTEWIYFVYPSNYPASGSSVLDSPSSSNLNISNYRTFAGFLDGSRSHSAAILGDGYLHGVGYYYIEIDINDYQNSGYSLSDSLSFESPTLVSDPSISYNVGDTPIVAGTLNISDQCRFIESSSKSYTCIALEEADHKWYIGLAQTLWKKQIKHLDFPIGFMMKCLRPVRSMVAKEKISIIL